MGDIMDKAREHYNRLETLQESLEMEVWNVNDLNSIKEIKVSLVLHSHIMSQTHNKYGTFPPYLVFDLMNREVPIVMDMNEPNYTIIFNWSSKSKE
jgi:formylmethanofuran dehydrogenase subunit E-like metal-binding protein